MFGEFFCEACDNKWFSGNAWENKGQQCFKCGRMIQAKNLRPLQRSLGPRGPPHREDLCEMCKELGYNCRNYRPIPSADDDDDDRSVLSVSSFSTDSSETSRGFDEDITPTASDEEDIVDLAKKIASLDLDKYR